MQSLITLERTKYIFAPIAVMCFGIILTLMYTTGDNITLGDYNTIGIILLAALLISLYMTFVSIYYFVSGYINVRITRSICCINMYVTIYTTVL